MTISVCWEKLAFPWTKKEKKYKAGEVNEPQQSGLLPDRLSSSLSLCFHTTSLLIGEVSVEEKMWFSPEYMCISSVSGVYEYFPFFINNDLLDVHVSCQCLDFPEIGFGHAQLSWITRTNGGRTKHSRYHFMRADFQVMETIFIASCLQGVEGTVHIGSCGKNEIISLDSQICDSLENVKVTGKRKKKGGR
ncbi:hypothetical protein V6N13_023388 [Hibiscus sabdariffa]|uniref:Uncharacterized protein n=1 Tax=Hibiscus sabdariffa TaxID=183260 RepID=A0ABR2PLL7_9ROSI